MRVVPDDLESVDVSLNHEVSELDDKELLKLHYQSWQSVEVAEVYSTADVRHEMRARCELCNRGWKFHPSFPYYSHPDRPRSKVF